MPMKESDIRPQETFEKFYQLTKKDSLEFFKNVTFDRIFCPACGGNDLEHAFLKHGFNYETCNHCDTLFNNPRPSEEAIRRYFSEAPSVKFWMNHFYQETEEIRREKIFVPRGRLVIESVKKFSPDKNWDKIKWIADIGSGAGVFCEEMKKLAPSHVEVLAIEPLPTMSKLCEERGLTVIPKCLEELKVSDLPIKNDSKGVFTAFEMIMYVQNPLVFFENCKRLLTPGDLLIFSGLNGMGMDILVLWEKYRTLLPPHCINFFNPKSITILLERAGFKTCEVTTPGHLDIQLIESSLEELSPDRFWKYFFKQLDENGKKELQEFLSRNKISSHMMVVAQCL
jgi:SAM-dependent methyltransferase